MCFNPAATTGAPPAPLPPPPSARASDNADRAGIPSQTPTGDQFDTKLTPQEEQKFQQWKQKYAPQDNGSDYDLRGAFKAGITPDGARGHFPDTYKKPNHPTFSNQSIYNGQPDGNGGTFRGGVWGEGDSFTPGATNLKYHNAADEKAYFKRVEPNSKLNLPGDSGSTSNFKTTHYGYADDSTPDSDTRAGNGKWGKLVDGESLALTDSMAKKLGAKPGDKIELTDSVGKKRVGKYVDRAPQGDDRVDIYNPRGSEKQGVPFNAVSAKRITIQT